MSEIVRTKAEREAEQARLRNAMISKLRSGITTKSGEFSNVGEYSRDMCLLLDRSGSMSEKIDLINGWLKGGPNRLDRLRELVRDFGGVRQFQYNHEIRELRKEEQIEDAKGGNDEVKAFNFLKLAGIKRVVMLTDGGADQPERALEAAKGLSISVIYIGPDPAPLFLQDLCKQTGGEYSKGDLRMLKVLSATVKERLGIEAPKSKTIIL